jgi:hypothetical protein
MGMSLADSYWPAKLDLMSLWGWGHGPPWWERAARWWYHDHLWHWWHVWHLTEAQGTVTVAIMAILVSTWWNWRTLLQARRIADDTLGLGRQQRADLRGDVLRTELSRWLTVVSEVERTSGQMLRRIQMTNMQQDENGNPVDVAEINRMANALKSAIQHDISEPLTNYATQATQIQMLTADETIWTNVHFITQSILGKSRNLNTLIDIIAKNARRPPDEQARELWNYLVDVGVAVGQDKQYTIQINVARSDLINYVIVRFNPTAVMTAARVRHNFPNVLEQLQPTNVWRRPQPQPTAADPPADAPDPPTDAPDTRTDVGDGEDADS